MAANQRPNVRWNFAWAALSGALFELGTAFVGTTTVAAAFVVRVTSSAVAVGAAEAIARLGWLAPQLLVAHYAQGVRRRKPIYLAAGWGRAGCLALLAGMLWAGAPVFGPLAAGGVAVLFFALWTAFACVSGLAAVPYNDVIGRTIPADRRSRLLAVRMFAGGLLAMGAGLGIRVLLGGVSEEGLAAYGMIFGMGAVVLAASTGCFALMREPPAPLARARPPFPMFLAEGMRVLRGDRRFRTFLWAQLFAGLSAMTAPFYVLQARWLGRVAEAEIGTFLAAEALGALMLNPLWGWWGDRRGKLSLLRALAVTELIGPILALGLGWMVSPDSRLVLPGYAAAFLVVGAAAGGRVVADLGYLMEISPDERRAEYSGYMNVLVAPSRLLPLLAGMLVELFSFRIVFLIAVGSGLLRLAILGRLARIPENGQAPAITSRRA